MKPIKLSRLWQALGKKLPTDRDFYVKNVTTDSRAVGEDSVFIALKGVRFNGHDFVAQAVKDGAKAVVVSEKCDVGRLENCFVAVVPDTVQAYLDMAQEYRTLFKIPVIAVTGSVGKTTTKDMIAGVLSQKLRTVKTKDNLNNEIGLPATIFSLEEDSQALVVELGMQGFGEIRQLAHCARPTVGVITNIGVSHMDQLGSRQNICLAKMELAEYLREKTLLLSGDDDLLKNQHPDEVCTIFYGLERENSFSAKLIQTGKNGTSFTLVDSMDGHYTEVNVKLPCVGEHNVKNALAAYGVGRFCGLSAESCAKGLARYTPSGMRQKVTQWNGCTVVEDCYNASPDSMGAALEALHAYSSGNGKRIAVFGDMLELGILEQTAHEIVGAHAAKRADMLFCFGTAAKGYVKGAGERIPAKLFTDKKALAQAVLEAATPGSVIWVKASRGMHLEEVLNELYEMKK